MAGFLFHINASAICPHGGQVTVNPSSNRVLISGQPAAVSSDTYLIAGCPFIIPPGIPHPCIKIQWLEPAKRVTINGQPAILQTSQGLCQAPDQAPQGPPIVVATQTRVTGI